MFSKIQGDGERWEAEDDDAKWIAPVEESWLIQGRYCLDAHLSEWINNVDGALEIAINDEIVHESGLVLKLDSVHGLHPCGIVLTMPCGSSSFANSSSPGYLILLYWRLIHMTFI